MMRLQDPGLFKTQCYVGGNWIAADNGSLVEVDNPSTGEIIGTVPRCGGAEMRRAIEAASEAFAGWHSLAPRERGALLLAWHDLIRQNKMDLARLLTLEQGKPVAESLGEIALGCSYLPWYAEECRRAYGDVIPAPRKGVHPVTHRQPVGVVCAITPWNFPMSMVTRKTGPALAAGCPVILKPASATPYSALALAELADRAGFPQGVFSVITGDARAIGAETAANSLVRKISFTGSTEVGKTLMADSARTMKRLSLELGGNAPFIVFDDADLDAAVAGCMGSKFRNAGQTCICANRILVHESVSEEFTRKLAERAAALKVGDGFEEGTEIGPLINADAVEFVDGLVRDATGKGAAVLTGGKRHERGLRFYEPTVISGLTRDMRLFNEEIFGPVAPIMTFTSDDEAVALANDTPYGLASYICTRDLGRSWKISERLEYGLVGVNEVGLAIAEAPFGGVKESGTGREGGREGLQDFMETRYVLMGVGA